jgi:hypothetical protein
MSALFSKILYCLKIMSAVISLYEFTAEPHYINPVPTAILFLLFSLLLHVISFMLSEKGFKVVH